MAVIVQRTGADASVFPRINLIEDAAAYLLPAATLHIALAIAIEGRRPALATALLVAGYVVGGLGIMQAAFDPAHPIGFDEGGFALFGLSSIATAWAFALARAFIFGSGIVYLVIGLRAAGDDRARRRQLLFALATMVLGVIGGMARILPEEIGGPRFVGVSLVAVAIVLATYAVLSQHMFVAADVAGRAVRWSLIAGLGIVVYVGALILLERAAAEILAIDFPLVTTLAVVVTLALFDPAAERVRQLTAGTPRQVDHARLLVALGKDAMLAQDPEQAVEPALARLVRTFELVGAGLEEPNGTMRAKVGRVDPTDPLAVRLDLSSGGEGHGAAIFGPKRSGLSFTPTEREALTLAASYLGSSLRLAERHQEQASALAVLRAERADVQSRGSALSEALADASSPPPGLHVFALGSLRAELNGDPVRRWGGEKAGSRQAEAIFAILFDRGDRGASKDEILELVWPDVDLDRADVAFHRTMLGLRSDPQAGAAEPRIDRTDRLPQRPIPARTIGRGLERLGRVRTAPVRCGPGRPGRGRRGPGAGACPLSRRLPGRLPLLRRQRPGGGSQDGRSTAVRRRADRARGTLRAARRPHGGREQLPPGPGRRGRRDSPDSGGARPARQREACRTRLTRGPRRFPARGASLAHDDLRL